MNPPSISPCVSLSLSLCLGVCLTVTELLDEAKTSAKFGISPETLRKTNLGKSLFIPLYLLKRTLFNRSFLSQVLLLWAILLIWNGLWLLAVGLAVILFR